jgi:hypothetical protein
MNVTCIAIFTTAALLTAQAASAQDRRGDQVFLKHEEIARVMEKIPPQMELLSGPDNVNWQCTNIDLREHCGDLDGCTANLHMAHKLDPNDMVRGIKEYMYFENALSSQQKGAGLNGYTRQAVNMAGSLAPVVSTRCSHRGDGLVLTTIALHSAPGKTAGIHRRTEIPS